MNVNQPRMDLPSPAMKDTNLKSEGYGGQARIDAKKKEALTADGRRFTQIILMKSWQRPPRKNIRVDPRSSAVGFSFIRVCSRPFAVMVSKCCANAGK
jgi:hypothetical protein